MATAIISKSSKKLFSNKSFKLSFPSFIRPSPKNPSSITTTADTPLEPSSSCSTSNKQHDNNKKKLKHVFDHFDVDKDGKISSKELMDYFASVGESLTHKVAKRVIHDFDSDGDELLEYGDFVRLIEEEEDKNETEDVLRSAFEMFEVDKGCGCITPKGLQQMLRQLGDVKSHEECAAMIRVFDLDGNGLLDFHEFQHMMSPTSKTPLQPGPTNT